MPRPLSLRQAREHARFLRRLAETGNARLSARDCGLHRSTLEKRRRKHPAFAAQWEAALAAAQANLHRPPRRTRAAAGTPDAYPAPAALRTSGGEPVVIRLASGRFQLRRALPGRMTAGAEQAFLRALAASANVRLAAAATGFAHSSFYARRDAHRPFAREMRLALAAGWEALDTAMRAAALAESHADDAWRRNDPAPIPQLTPAQALQLLCLHQNSVQQGWDRPHRRRRRGEPWPAYTARLRAMWAAEAARQAEDDALARAARAASPDDARCQAELDPHEEIPPLPDLDQVTGWSKADPAKPPHNPHRALFGGWRIGDWKKQRG